MSLLNEIQASVLQEDSDLGPILLKLRLLAARLGSQPLADWVKHESEGYPVGSEVPSYRIVGVTYRGTFFGAFGSSITNTPIPSFLIAKFAGEKWNTHEIRDSIAAVDDLLASSSKGTGTLTINASNLALLLQGKVYEDYACNSVTGTLSRAAVAALRHSVRARVLELTIELEKSIPEAAKIELGKADTDPHKTSAVATQISQQIIYGNMTSITSTGDGAQVNVVIDKGDTKALIERLKSGGIPEADATEFAEIVASEKPESKEEPLGAKAKHWLVKNLKKAGAGTWKAGVSVATKLITEAALKYYGL